MDQKNQWASVLRTSGRLCPQNQWASVLRTSGRLSSEPVGVSVLRTSGRLCPQNQWASLSSEPMGADLAHWRHDDDDSRHDGSDADVCVARRNRSDDGRHGALRPRRRRHRSAGTRPQHDAPRRGADRVRLPPTPPPHRPPTPPPLAPTLPRVGRLS